MATTSLVKALSLLSVFLAPAAAQTWSACNPMNVTTCPDNPALGLTYNYDFSNANNASTWNATAGNVIYGAQGGEFTINKRYDSPTIQSEFYIMFGVVEVHLKAAAGQGVISSIVMESDDLDEVDWEFMGGNDTHAETNYFGKGNTTLFNRAIYYPVATPQQLFHNYTVHWTKDAIEWYIDTNLVRTLHYADALGGYNFPQTPMNIRLGIWAGGDPSNNNGTIQWAGGLTDFSKGPYTMYIQSIKVQDYGSGKAYHWSDKTGSYESIKEVIGNSTAAQTLTAPPQENLSMSQKWSKLTPGVRIGIYSAAGAFAAAFAGFITFCCIKQRRAGRRERDAYNSKLEQDRLEAESFQMDSKDPDALPSSATPNQYNGTDNGHDSDESFRAPVVSTPPSYVGLNNNPRSASSTPLNGARSPPPTGPLPTPGGFGPVSPYGDEGMHRNGSNSVLLNPGNGPPQFNNGPGSVRSNTGPGPAGGFSDFAPNRSVPTRPGPPAGFSDFAPNRSASAGPGMMSRGFTASPGPYSDNGPRQNGPGNMRNFTAPGGYNGPSSHYGDGGIRSPSVPIGYADGGIQSQGAGPNYSHPNASNSPNGFSSPRAMSPRVQSPRDYYGPGSGPQQFGGSSGGNYFSGGNSGNGYVRPGAF